MRVLFVGGGTGGHLTPALGLAEALEARGHETLFLISGRAVERDFFADGRRHASLGFDESGLPRPLALIGAMRRARAEARRFAPSVTVALGGAASAAALAVTGPRVLLEGNAVAGRSVRWMQPFARATLTLFAATAGTLRGGVCVGPLARRALRARPRGEARAALGLPGEGALLLVLGGSQGATALNRAALALAPSLAAQGARALLLCGPGRAAELAAAAARWPDTLTVREHCADMGAAYSAADFALARGGASTVAELWLHALPAVIVPYPHHRDRQQEHNALALAPGLAVVREEHLDDAALARIAAATLEPALRAPMRAHLESLRARSGDGSALAVRALEEIAVSAA